MKLKRIWCQLTFRHRGKISHDEKGVYWECIHCHGRSYVSWDEMNVIPFRAMTEEDEKKEIDW